MSRVNKIDSEAGHKMDLNDYQLVEITHFINPHVFWINRLEENDDEYKHFYKKLQEFVSKAPVVDHCQIGEVYAVKHPSKNIWLRAEFEREIDIETASKKKSSDDCSFKVWLLDDGRPETIFNPPRKLSKYYREKETKCERAILFGVSPATQELKHADGAFQVCSTDLWQVNSSKVVYDLLRRKGVQTFFKTRSNIKDTVLGDVVVAVDNRRINLAQYLSEKKIAILNDERFITGINEYAMSPKNRVKTPSIPSRNSSATLREDDFEKENTPRDVEILYGRTSVNDLIGATSSRASLRSRESNESSKSNDKRKIASKDVEISYDRMSVNDLMGVTSSRASLKSRRSNDSFERKTTSKIYDHKSVSSSRTSLLSRGSNDSAVLKDVEISYDITNVNDLMNTASSRVLSKSRAYSKSPDSSDTSGEIRLQRSVGRGTRRRSKPSPSEVGTTTPCISEKPYATEEKLSARKKLFEASRPCTIKKDPVHYLSNKRLQEEKCIGIIKNIDDLEMVSSSKENFQEEVVINNMQLEDDAEFLARMRAKEEKKQAEKTFADVPIVLDSPSTSSASLQITTKSSDNNSKLGRADRLSKIFKFKSSQNTNGTDSSSSQSDNFRKSTSQSNRNTTSDVDTDLETSTSTCDKDDFPPVNWPVGVASNAPKNLNIIPAGSVIPHPTASRRTNSREDHSSIARPVKKSPMLQNIECDDEEEDTFFEQKMKSARDGRNIKTTPIVDPFPEQITSDNKDQFRLLIHSSKRIKTFENIGQAYLSADLLQALKDLELITLDSLESHVWPYINRGENVVAIWRKTYVKYPCLMYLPIICNTILQSNYDDLGNNNGPFALIICAHKTAARNVYQILLHLLRTAAYKEEEERRRKRRERIDHFKSRTRACLLLGNMEVVRGCEFVVTTVRSFLQRVRSVGGFPTDLNRLCHLVLDDADIITTRNKVELHDIFQLCQSMLKRRRNAVRNIQLVMTAQTWTNGIEEVCRMTPVKPAIFIKSYIEAAVYGKVNIHLRFIENELKVEQLHDLVYDKYKTHKIVVLCKGIDEIYPLADVLQGKGVRVVQIAHDIRGSELNDTITSWTNAVSGNYQLLILSDDLLPSVNVTSGMYLIHYTLPATWSQFCRRFSTLKNNYKPLFGGPTVETVPPKVEIFVDETNPAVIPRLTFFLERMNAVIDREKYQMLTEIKEKVIYQREYQKIKNDQSTPLCLSLLTMGQCHNQMNCKSRHIFVKEVDSEPKVFDIAIGTKVELRLLNIHDATHFSAYSNKQEHIENYKLLQLEMIKYYQREEYAEELRSCTVGEIYAYKKTTSLYERCKILKELDARTSGSCYRIWLIDIEQEKIVDKSQLRLLPQHLKAPLQHVLHVFVADVKPFDDEIIWDSQAKTQVETLFTESDVYKPNMFITGFVRLVVGRFVWLEKISINEKFTETVKEKLNLSVQLIREQIVMKNPDHITYLIQMCKQAAIDVQIGVQKKPERKKPPPPPIKVEMLNAHMDIVDRYEKVFFLSTEGGGKFNLGREVYDHLLNDLLKEITTTAITPSYPTKVDLLDGGYCLVYNIAYSLYYRAQIRKLLPDNEVVCYLVDEGYEEIFSTKQLKPILPWMLTRLPAQAITCRLYGVPVDVTGLEIYEDFTTLWCKTVKRDHDGVYSVFLVKRNGDDNILINSKVLADYEIPDERVEEEKHSIPLNFEDQEIENNVEPRDETLEDDVILEQEYDSNGEEVYDVQIPDVREFYKGLIKFPELEPKAPVKQIEAPKYTTEAYPLSDTLTPTVLWYQNPDEIILKIQLPAIEVYHLDVTNKDLHFSTEYQDRPYTLHLTFYDDIDSKNIDHESKGLEIVVKLIKFQKATPWPRLLSSKQRVRNIKLDLENEISSDEEEKTVKKRFLSAIGDLSDVDDGQSDEFEYDFGSDLDDSSDCSDDFIEKM